MDRRNALHRTAKNRSSINATLVSSCIAHYSNIIVRENSLAALQIHKHLFTTQRLHLELGSCLSSKSNSIVLLYILVLLVHLDHITLSLLARGREIPWLFVIGIVVQLLGLARAGGLGRLWCPRSAWDAAIDATAGGAAELLVVLAG